MNHPHARRQAILIVVLLLATVLTILPVPSAALRYAKGTSLKNVDASYIGENANDDAAQVVRNVGDLNGDGYDDFAVDAHLNDDGGTDAGQIYVIFGKPSGWAMDKSLSNANASYLGEASDDYAGMNIDGIGDFNGDGYDDFTIGVHYNSETKSYAGQVYIIFGRPSGWAMDTKLGKANASIRGKNLNQYLGNGVSGLGDVNGDGFDDVLVEGLNDTILTNRGEVFLLLGSDSGWKMDMGLSAFAGSFIGEAKNARILASSGAIGDVNGDGYDDIMLRASTGNGKVYIFFGKPGGWTFGINASSADATFIGEKAGDWFGYYGTGVGDVNGDGLDDFLIGASGNDDVADSAGKAYLFFGKKTGWGMDVPAWNADASFRGENKNDRAGHTVARAGDANGDGLNDLLISAPDNNAGAGRVYLILGKTSGWSRNVSLSTADTNFVGESGNNNAGLMEGLSGGGDVNGDGLDDFLVGAWANNEGGTQAGQAYLIFPDLATKPNPITSVKVYSDKACTNQISTAKLGDVVYVELVGTDTNASRTDTAVVDVSGPSPAPPGLWLDLRETGLNTGKFRGNFTVKEITDDKLRWIAATDSKKLIISSIQDRTKNATLDLNLPLTLKPNHDNPYATEDQLYQQHYWAKYGTVSAWTVQTNASWLKWNSTTHNISGTPANSDVGTYWVRLNITDGSGGYDQHNFTLAVANVPAKITTANKLAATEDALYSVDYASNDDPTTTWTAKTNATWLTLAASTGLLSGTPNNTAVGKSWVNVTCDDGHGGRTSSNFTVTVSNVPPAFTTPAVTSTTEDMLYSTDYNTDDDPAVTYSLNTNSSFLTINATTGVLSGTPINKDVGLWAVNITAKDNHGAKAFRAFTLSVTNTGPIISTGDVLMATEDVLYQNNYNSTDDPTTTWSLKTDADFLKLNTSSGLLNGTPDNGDVGNHNVNITVNDGYGLTDYRNFTLSVINTPPAITTPDNTMATEDVLYRMDYNSSDDKDFGSVMSWNLTTNASWLAFDNSTGILSGTPINKDVGSYWVNVSVTDGNGGRAYTNFTLTVVNANPNIMTDNVLSAVEDEEYFVHYGCDDDDGLGTIRWSLSTTADWLQIDPVTGILNGTPDNSMVRRYDIVVTVDDGHGGLATAKFSLNVVNKPPEITTVPASGIYERSEYYVDFNSTDDGLGIIYWSMPQGPSWLIMDHDTGVLIGTPENKDVGQHQIKILVSDGNGGEGYLNYTLDVLNIDDPPMWTRVPQDTTINKGENYTFDVDAIMPDIGKSPKYGISSEPLSSIIIDVNTGVISWVPKDYGRFNITVSFGSSTQTIYHKYTIIVNIPPTITLVAPTDGATMKVVNPSFQWTATDVNGDNITADLYYGTDQAAVKSLSVQVKMGQGLKDTYYIPGVALDKGRTYYWTVVPDDGHIKGTCTSGVWSFKIETNATVNTPPKFTSSPDMNAQMGVQWSYEPKASDDNPGDVVTIKLVSGPTGMMIESGVLKWTPGQTGQFKVKLETTDGKGGVYQEFTLTVTKPGTVNHAPVINQVKYIRITEGEKVSIAVIATDADGDTLQFDILSGPSGATISPNGYFVWQTKKGDAGEYNIVVRASDGIAQNSSTFQIKVVKTGSSGMAMAGVLSAIVVVAVVSAIVAFLVATRRKKASDAKPSEKQPVASASKPTPKPVEASTIPSVTASRSAAPQPEVKKNKPLAEPPNEESVTVVETIDIDDLKDGK